MAGPVPAPTSDDRDDRDDPDDRDDWDHKVEAARRLLREAISRPEPVPVSIRSRRTGPAPDR